MARMTPIPNSNIPAVLQKIFSRFSSKSEELEKRQKVLLDDLKKLNQELEESHHQLEKKQAELQIATDYLDALLGHISQGILFLDHEGTIVIYNEAAAAIFGKSAESVLFQPFWENFTDEMFGFSPKKALASRECPNILYTTWSPVEGTKYELEISPSFFRHDKVDGLVIRVRNITEIRHWQAAAERHDRLQEIGTLTSNVAHEIRNPLSGIKGFASLLERDLKEEPKMQQMAKAIVEGADSLNELVSNILDYSRPLTTHFEEVDLIHLLEEIRENIQAAPDFSPNITFTIQAKESKCLVVIDQNLVRAALMNLVLNAVQAMPQGGKIEINAEKKPESTIVKIQDTGVGISEENLKKIWTPYFTTKEKGNGLGLANVHKIMEIHHAAVEVQSEIGKGTTFTIKIPPNQ